jgi:hypothetical protein
MGIKSYDNLMISSINRIKDGFYFDENYHPYTREFLDVMITYFKDKEDYESCQLLKNVIDKRFNHENGYKSPI